MYNKDIHEGGTVLPPSAHILPLSAPRGAHLQLGAYQEPCHDSNLCILTSQWRTSISGVYFISYYQTSPCYSRDTNDMVSHTSILLSPRSRSRQLTYIRQRETEIDLSQVSKFARLSVA